MELEVGDRHRAAGEKGGPAGEQAEGDQETGDELDEAANPELGADLRRLIGENAEDLLHAVKGEHQSGDDAQGGVDGFGQGCESTIHGRCLLIKS